MNNNKDTQGLFLTIVGVLTLVVAIVGASFAYFAASVSGNNNIKAESYNFSVTLSVSKVAPTDATIDKLIPLNESDISTAVTGFDSHPCVDKNGYAACAIYDLTFNNTSGYSLTMNGSITPTTNGFSNGQLYYRVGATNSGATFASAGATRLTTGAHTANLTGKTIGTGTSHLYLLLYIKNDTTGDQPDDKGKTFTGTVTFTNADGSGSISATFS